MFFRVFHHKDTKATKENLAVIAGPDPAIHVSDGGWMPGSSPGMTTSSLSFVIFVSLW
ncbi:Metallophosphoesterase (modular protein) [Magnetospirillum sp. UT-4]|nr:Metallophosphoesterase (modular protein) [Magnetospirillum sp. UT-4]